jgi:hypothetical protein
MEKETLSICAKLGIVMPLLIFKIQYTNLGGALFVLSPITKKGEIESASRPLMDFGD